MQSWSSSEGIRRPAQPFHSPAAFPKKNIEKVSRDGFESRPDAEDFSASSSTNWSSSDCSSSVDETVVCDSSHGSREWQGDSADVLAGRPHVFLVSRDESYWVPQRDAGHNRGSAEILAGGAEPQRRVFPSNAYPSGRSFLPSAQTAATLPSSCGADERFLESYFRPRDAVTRETGSDSRQPAREQSTAMPSTSTAGRLEKNSDFLETRKRMTGAEGRAVVLGLLHDLLESLPTANVEDVLGSLEPIKNFSGASSTKIEGASRSLSEDGSGADTEQTLCSSSVEGELAPRARVERGQDQMHRLNTSTGRMDSSGENSKATPDTSCAAAESRANSDNLSATDGGIQVASTLSDRAGKPSAEGSLRASVSSCLTHNVAGGFLRLGPTSSRPYIVVPSSPVTRSYWGSGAEEGLEEASPPTFSLVHRRLCGEDEGHGPEVVAPDAVAPCSRPEDCSPGVATGMAVTESASKQSSVVEREASTTIEKRMAEVRDWLAWANSFGYVPGLYSSQHLERTSPQGDDGSHATPPSFLSGSGPGRDRPEGTANTQPTAVSPHVTFPLPGSISLQELQQREQGLFQEIQAFLRKRCLRTSHAATDGPTSAASKGSEEERKSVEHDGNVEVTGEGAIPEKSWIDAQDTGKAPTRVTSPLPSRVNGMESVSRARLGSADVALSEEDRTALHERGSSDGTNLSDRLVAVGRIGPEARGDSVAEQAAKEREIPVSNLRGTHWGGRRGCPPLLSVVCDDPSQLRHENDATAEGSEARYNGIKVVALPERRMPVTPQHLLQTPRPAVLKGSNGPGAAGVLPHAASVTGDDGTDEGPDRRDLYAEQAESFSSGSGVNEQTVKGVEEVDEGQVQETVVHDEEDGAPAGAERQPDQQRRLADQLSTDDGESCSVYSGPLLFTTAVSLDELFPDSMNAGTQTLLSDFWTRLATPRGASLVFSRNRRLPHTCRSGPPEVFLYDPSASHRQARSPQEMSPSAVAQTESPPPSGTPQARTVPTWIDVKDLSPFSTPGALGNPYLVNLQAPFSPSLPPPLISLHGYPSISGGLVHPHVTQTVGLNDGYPFDFSLGYHQPYVPGLGVSMATAPYLHSESAFNTAPGSVYGWGPDGLPIWSDPTFGTPVTESSQLSPS